MEQMKRNPEIVIKKKQKTAMYMIQDNVNPKKADKTIYNYPEF